MKSQGILNLKESSVSVEVANMPITMLTVPPSEISLEVIKILDKQKRINFLWTYISLFASLVITLVTAEKFNKFVFSGEFWKFTFCALAIYFLYKILNTLWNIRKNGLEVNPEEVADNLLKKARSTKTVTAINQADSIDFQL